MADTGVREHSQENTRAAIVAAATELFSLQGFRATTITQISARANIAPRTFFSYYESKEDVLFWHLEEDIDAACAVLEGDGPTSDLATRLLEAIDLIIERSGEVRTFTTMRADVVGRGKLPSSLVRGVASAHGRLLASAHRRFPAAAESGEATALIGAVLGAVAAAGIATVQDIGEADWQRSLRTAAERAAVGFRAPDAPTP